jgi:hypothetical protein
VFDLERRIYRVDQLRLNPTGVPVRGVLYALALIVLALVCASLPALEIVMHALPWYLAYVALPIGCAVLLSVIRIDGRPFHLAAQALLGYRLKPRQSVGLRRTRAGSGVQVGARWCPPEILVLPDGSDAHVRRLRYTGPGAVLVSVGHICDEPHRGVRGIGQSHLRLHERPGAVAGAGVTVVAEPKVIALARAARLSVG